MLYRIVALSILLAAGACGLEEVPGGRASWDAVLWTPTPSQTEARSCTEPAGSADSIRPIVTGEYLLTLVATSGPRVGGKDTGRLILKTATPQDRSPRTGKRATDLEGEEALLYGAAMLDWGAIAAPVFDDGPPPPRSLDPVYPGVLVLYHGDDQVIFIGTLSNLRDGYGWLDGSGIQLRVTAADADRLHGSWDAWGIVTGGAGYFCADRLDL